MESAKVIQRHVRRHPRPAYPRDFRPPREPRCARPCLPPPCWPPSPAARNRPTRRPCRRPGGRHPGRRRAGRALRRTVQAGAGHLDAAVPGRCHPDRRPPLRRPDRRPLGRRQAEGPGRQQVAARRTGQDRRQAALAREPGRRRDPAQPAAIGYLERRSTAELGLGPAGLQQPRRQRDLWPDGARIRAAARAHQVGHRAHGEDPADLRPGTREPGPGAGAADPRTDRGQAEPGHPLDRGDLHRPAPGRAGAGRRRPHQRRHRRPEEGGGRTANLARQDPGAERQGRFPCRRREVRPEAEVCPGLLALAPGHQAARRSRTQRACAAICTALPARC